MHLAVWIVILLPACTVTLWSAIAAGRAQSRSSRYTWVAVQAASFFVAVMASVFGAFAPTNPNVGRLVVVAWWIGLATGGFGGAGAFVYLLYALRGRRSAFGADLRESLWMGRTGISRLGGGRPRPL